MITFRIDYFIITIHFCALEFTRRLQVVRVQPVSPIVKQHGPDVVTCPDRPTGGVPKPRSDASVVRVLDQFRQVRELAVGDLPNSVPADRYGVVC